MHVWQYCKIDLNDLPRRTEDVDRLNDAGSEGWEAITITSNRIAYLMRQVARPASASVRASSRVKA
jgi:hypothetical protein